MRLLDCGHDALILAPKQNTSDGCWGFQAIFDLLNFIAQCGRFFVGFVFHCDLELAPQLDEPKAILVGFAGLLRDFSAVLSPVMNVFKELIQLGFKHLIVVRTTQAALAAKLSEGDPTVRTSHFVSGFQILDIQAGTGLIVVLIPLSEIFLRARLTQMQLLHFTFTNLGDVQSGRLGTATAFLHDVGTPGFRPKARRILAVVRAWSRNGLSKDFRVTAGNDQ